MEIKVISKELYIANDGTEFADKKECEKYEKVLKEINYFVVSHSPDRTESGNYQCCTMLAIHSAWGIYGESIAQEWALRTFKNFLIKGVQGNGVMPAFEVRKCTKNDFISSLENKYVPHVYLSERKIPSFSENYINYYESWNLD